MVMRRSKRDHSLLDRGRSQTLSDMLAIEKLKVDDEEEDWLRVNQIIGESAFSFSLGKDEVMRQGVDIPLPRTKKLPFESTVTSLINPPTAPFEATEQKKAYTSALFYSECFMKGVTPQVADNAAKDIEARYNKWWSKFNPSISQSESSVCESKATESNVEDNDLPGGSLKRKQHPSDGVRNAKRRRQRHHDIRYYIEEHTLDPYYFVPPDEIPAETTQVTSRFASLVMADKKKQQGNAVTDVNKHDTPGTVVSIRTLSAPRFVHFRPPDNLNHTEGAKVTKAPGVVSDDDSEGSSVLMKASSASLAMQATDASDFAVFNSPGTTQAMPTVTNAAEMDSAENDKSDNLFQKPCASSAPLPSARSMFASSFTLTVKHQIASIRDRLIMELKTNGGDTKTRSFKSKLAILQSHYLTSTRGAPSPNFDGVWLSLSKPKFKDGRGRNELGQYVYTLGRMSFDMFRPTNLLCSIQGSFNTIHSVDPETDGIPSAIPRSLHNEVMGNLSNHGTESAGDLRTYNVVVAFTIEPNQTRNGKPVNNRAAHPVGSQNQQDYIIRRPIRGILTNYGYALPDPKVSNRCSIWFTGGSLEINDDEEDMKEWKQIFDEESLPRRDMAELARVVAAKVLLGAYVADSMEPDGTMNYSLTRPIGGHGTVYSDVLYLDDTLRIMRGHKGSIYVFQKKS